jgi:hypothetical protein
MDLEEVWRIREEKIFPEFFGSTHRGIFVLDQELFASRFNVVDIDPRWLFYGVLEFAPTLTRPSWLYVTSGYSNPWDDEPKNYDPAGLSGAGVEFVFATAEQGDWAVRTLQNMLAFDLLLCANRFANGKPLGVGDRVPLRAPLNGDPGCLIRSLVMVEPEDIPDGFALPSGTARFQGFTGATDAEITFAKEHTSAQLIDALRRAGYHPVTDPRRPSLF